MFAPHLGSWRKKDTILCFCFYAWVALLYFPNFYFSIKEKLRFLAFQKLISCAKKFRNCIVQFAKQGLKVMNQTIISHIKACDHDHAKFKFSWEWFLCLNNLCSFVLKLLHCKVSCVYHLWQPLLLFVEVFITLAFFLSLPVFLSSFTEIRESVHRVLQSQSLARSCVISWFLWEFSLSRLLSLGKFQVGIFWLLAVLPHFSAYERENL